MKKFNRTTKGFFALANIKFLLLSILLILLAKPYFVWHNGLDVFILLVFSFYCISYIPKNHGAFLPFFFTFILFTTYAILNQASIVGAFFILLVPFYLFIPVDVKVKLLDSFVETYKWLMVISMVVFLMVLAGIPLPYNTIEPLNDVKNYTYSQYPFLVIANLKFVDFSRFCGPFDEPGVVGTISGTILATYRNHLSKKTYIILLCSGILSFSLFFFIIFILSLLTTQVKTVLVATALILLISYFGIDREVMDKYVYSRIEITNEGLSGDNRTDANFDIIYDNFVKSPDLLTGSGDKVLGEEGSSYKIFIYKFGLLFFLLTLLYFIVYSLSKLKRIASIYIFFLVLVGMTYQRPYYFDPFYFFIFIAIIERLNNFETSNFKLQVSVTKYGR